MPSLTSTVIPSKGAYFYGYDLTKYSTQGFLITPHEYRERYLVTGIFTHELIPEIKWDKSIKLMKESADLYPTPSGFKKKIILVGSPFTSENDHELYYILFVELINADQAIEKAVEFVRNSGGDGIMDFQISQPNRSGYIEGKHFDYSIVKIDGVGIKRQN